METTEELKKRLEEYESYKNRAIEISKYDLMLLIDKAVKKVHDERKNQYCFGPVHHSTVTERLVELMFPENNK